MTHTTPYSSPLPVPVSLSASASSSPTLSTHTTPYSSPLPVPVSVSVSPSLPHTLSTHTTPYSSPLPLPVSVSPSPSLPPTLSTPYSSPLPVVPSSSSSSPLQPSPSSPFSFLIPSTLLSNSNDTSLQKNTENEDDNYCYNFYDNNSNNDYVHNYLNNNNNNSKINIISNIETNSSPTVKKFSLDEKDSLLKEYSSLQIFTEGSFPCDSNSSVPSLSPTKGVHSVFISPSFTPSFNYPIIVTPSFLHSPPLSSSIQKDIVIVNQKNLQNTEINDMKIVKSEIEISKKAEKNEIDFEFENKNKNEAENIMKNIPLENNETKIVSNILLTENSKFKEENDVEIFLFPIKSKSSNFNKNINKIENLRNVIQGIEAVFEVVQVRNEDKVVQTINEKIIEKEIAKKVGENDFKKVEMKDNKNNNYEKIEYFGNEFEDENDNKEDDDEWDEDCELTTLSDKTVLSREEMDGIKLELRLQREQLKQKELLEIEINNLQFQKQIIEEQEKLEFELNLIKINKKIDFDKMKKNDEDEIIKRKKIEDEKSKITDIKKEGIYFSGYDAVEMNNKEENVEESILERIGRLQRKDDEKINLDTLFPDRTNVLTPLPVKRVIPLSRVPSIRLPTAVRKTNESNMNNYSSNYNSNNNSNYNSDDNNDNYSDNGSTKNNKIIGTLHRNSSRSNSPSLLSRKPSLSSLSPFLKSKQLDKEKQNFTTNFQKRKKSKNEIKNCLEGKMVLNYGEKPFNGNGILNFISTEGGRNTYANTHMSGMIINYYFSFMNVIVTYYSYFLTVTIIIIVRFSIFLVFLSLLSSSLSILLLLLSIMLLLLL